jgi:hypothetical protein
MLPRPRYHCPFLYDDEDDTIGGHLGSEGEVHAEFNLVSLAGCQSPNRECAIRIQRKS